MYVPESFHDRNVCVMGLGYVGLTLATTLADVGFRVLGVEIREDVLALLEKGEPHFHEPGLKDRLRLVQRRGNLSFARRIPDPCDARVYVITVGTPLGEDGRPRMDMVESVAREVALHLQDGDLVIMRSTVRLGTTTQLVLPILEATGKSFDLAFCPERTLEGQALSELRELPQIIGATTPEAQMRAAQIFQFLTPTVVRVSDVETAEMIKMVDNVHRDVSFAFANEVARACDVVGIRATEVIRAGKLGYPRTNLPMPGPVGGPCLEKDPHIFIEGLAPFGIVPEITLAARTINERQPSEVVSKIASVLGGFSDIPPQPNVTLAGIAFKGRPETDDLRGTMARPILAELRRAFPGAVFRGYDPVVAESQLRDFGLEPVATLEDAFRDTHLLVILNNHPVFASMAIETLAGSMAQPALIYDFWNNFAASELHLPERRGYMALGSHGAARIPGV